MPLRHYPLEVIMVSRRLGFLSADPQYISACNISACPFLCPVHALGMDRRIVSNDLHVCTGHDFISCIHAYNRKLLVDRWPGPQSSGRAPVPRVFNCVASSVPRRPVRMDGARALSRDTILQRLKRRPVRRDAVQACSAVHRRPVRMDGAGSNFEVSTCGDTLGRRLDAKTSEGVKKRVKKGEEARGRKKKRK